MSSLPNITYEVNGKKHELKISKRHSIAKYAELCAEEYYENYHNNTDFDCDSPFELKLMIDGKDRGTFEANLEWNPYFFVYKKRKGAVVTKVLNSLSEIGTKNF